MHPAEAWGEAYPSISFLLASEFSHACTSSLADIIQLFSSPREEWDGELPNGGNRILQVPLLQNLPPPHLYCSISLPSFNPSLTTPCPPSPPPLPSLISGHGEAHQWKCVLIPSGAILRQWKWLPPSQEGPCDSQVVHCSPNRWPGLSFYSVKKNNPYRCLPIFSTAQLLPPVVKIPLSWAWTLLCSFELSNI